MDNFKIKVIISILSAIIFSLIFIILALVLPVKDESEKMVIIKPKNKLQAISQALENR